MLTPIETRAASKQRQSGIELLKIIAIIFIILSHCMPDGDAGFHSSAIDINLGGGGFASIHYSNPI